jgi:hypothetical protein
MKFRFIRSRFLAMVFNDYMKYRDTEKEKSTDVKETK